MVSVSSAAENLPLTEAEAFKRIDRLKGRLGLE
jgi:hypothetical protein